MKQLYRRKYESEAEYALRGFHQALFNLTLAMARMMNPVLNKAFKDAEAKKKAEKREHDRILLKLYKKLLPILEKKEALDSSRESGSPEPQGQGRNRINSVSYYHTSAPKGNRRAGE